MLKLNALLKFQCVAIVAALALIVGAMSQQASAKQPTFADCMRNPFAISCRGISAKRSQPTRIKGFPDLLTSGWTVPERSIFWQARPVDLLYQLEPTSNRAPSAGGE